MSRYMNPDDVEDREYFVGLPETTPQPTGDETWFGVWVRVENTSEDETRPSATTWEIHDTQENIYRPIPIDAEDNPFVYEPVDVPPKTVIPLSSRRPARGRSRASCCCSRSPPTPSRTARWSCSFTQRRELGPEGDV